MVDCTSFRGVWIVTVYSGVLMVATSVLPLVNLPAHFDSGHKPRVCGAFVLGFGGVWTQAGTHLKVMVSKTPSTQLGLLAWRDQASGEKHCHPLQIQVH